MNKQQFDNALDMLDLSRKKFSELSGMSYNTVGQWNDETKKIPAWVPSWLENYNYKMRYFKIKNLLDLS